MAATILESIAVQLYFISNGKRWHGPLSHLKYSSIGRATAPAGDEVRIFILGFITDDARFITCNNIISGDMQAVKAGYGE